MTPLDSSDIDLQAALSVAESSARAVGDLLRGAYRREKTIQSKSSAIDWVTEYDIAAEKLIAGRLAAAFPAHGLLGEEGSRRAAEGDLTWIVDPIDGTSNFAHRIPFFCVSLALYRADEPLVGVIYSPVLDECFSATAGGGAWLTVGGEVERLHVSHVTDLSGALLATGFPYDRHTHGAEYGAEVGRFLLRAHGIRRAGAAALDFAYVAAGRYDGYFEQKIEAWDAAAGLLLVQEAGGRCTDRAGVPLHTQVRTGQKLYPVVSNGHIHSAMLAVLNLPPS